MSTQLWEVKSSAPLDATYLEMILCSSSRKTTPMPEACFGSPTTLVSTCGCLWKFGRFVVCTTNLEALTSPAHGGTVGTHPTFARNKHGVSSFLKWIGTTYLLLYLFLKERNNYFPNRLFLLENSLSASLKASLVKRGNGRSSKTHSAYVL